MKLEFLNDITHGGAFPDAEPKQLIRLFAFNVHEVIHLRDLIRKNLVETSSVLNLHHLNFIEPINCKLQFCISDFDIGISTTDNLDFKCQLTVKGYNEMIHFLEPFCDRDTSGYQWICEGESPIELLLSNGGGW